MRSRAEEFRGAFRQGFLGAERIADGFRWRFRWRAGFFEDLRALANRERACCPFFRFDLLVAEEGREIWWEARARPEAAPVLEEFFRMPDVLRA